jgi:hypothetical protein
MVLEDAIEILQGAITRKAERLPAYLANCSTCWLLLVAHGASPSTFIEPDPASLEHVYFSPFQRTFLLRYFQGRVFALSTHAGEGAV